MFENLTDLRGRAFFFFCNISDGSNLFALEIG